MPLTLVPLGVSSSPLGFGSPPYAPLTNSHTLTLIGGINWKASRNIVFDSNLCLNASLELIKRLELTNYQAIELS